MYVRDLHVDKVKESFLTSYRMQHFFWTFALYKWWAHWRNEKLMVYFNNNGAVTVIVALSELVTKLAHMTTI
jgi:hypothetical protein